LGIALVSWPTVERAGVTVVVAVVVVTLEAAPKTSRSIPGVAELRVVGAVASAAISVAVEATVVVAVIAATIAGAVTAVAEETGFAAAVGAAVIVVVVAAVVDGAARSPSSGKSFMIGIPLSSFRADRVGL
jgi:hypothetical protein